MNSLTHLNIKRLAAARLQMGMVIGFGPHLNRDQSISGGKIGTPAYSVFIADADDDGRSRF
jgi:hypothetical protein